MRRPLLGLSVLSLFLGGSLAAAPVPHSRQKPRLYYPTKVGAKWVYQSQGKEWTQVVKAIESNEAHAGAMVVTVVKVAPDGEERFSDFVSVSERGLFSMTKEETTFRPSYCLLRLPDKLSRFDLDGSVVIHSKDRSMKLSGPERVEVPAGVFWAICVRDAARPNAPIQQAPAFPALPVPDPAFAIEMTQWYAPEVGLIKEKVWRGDVIHRLVELKSFTPGRD